MLGSFLGPRVWPIAIGMLGAGRFPDIKRIITQRFPLDATEQVLAMPFDKCEEAIAVVRNQETRGAAPKAGRLDSRPYRCHEPR